MVGQAWRPRNVGRGRHLDLLEIARFAMGHCHVGGFALPWHMEEWVICPWWRDNFTWEHII